MKKPLLLIGIFAWVLVLAVVVAALVGGWLFSGGFGIANRDAQANLLKEEYIELSGVKSILLQSDVADIEIIATADTQMRLLQYGGSHTAPEELFSVNQNGDAVQLRIKRNLRFFDFSFGLNEQLVVEIPAAWLGNVEASVSSSRIQVNDAFTWQNVRLSSSSGNIVLLRELTADNLGLSVNSGSIRAHEALTVSGSFEAESSSGNIHLDQPLTAQALYARANSGSISLDAATVEQFDLRASSGNISATALSGGGSARVNSGSINIGLREPLSDIDLQASSGSIRVEVDSSAAFNFEGRCSSGSIRANFPLEKNDKGNRASATVGAKPAFAINAETNSGSININQR